ncbi:Uncharacterized conserved protein [Balnearium lithotrophicum]|uniref:Uncharacterized conserved protein n=1 Tax=Balnearium lithotrophicum TaxID=223788 RepID=A0A521CRE7_9BACT|nr:DUF2163 domain-containing protein [Balnearium lithotrophicum]SMO62012.1 Uncharacterized conserved protein [Balnearium lithotrophicum]
MQSLPSETLKRLESLFSTTCLLLVFYLEEPLRFANLDIDVWYEGKRYVSVPFKIDEVSRDGRLTSDTLVVTFDNVSLIPASTFLNGDKRGNGAEVKYALIDDFGKPVSVFSVFDGIIDQVRIKDGTAEITLVSDLTRFSKNTFRKHIALCPWRFKDQNCKYSGPAFSCDKTYETCQKLGNTKHFGGFRYLPNIMEKQLPWGRKK